MNTRTTQYATSAKWPDDVQSVTTQPLKYAADMVLLARRCSLNYVLKRALYELVRAEGFRQETNPNSEDDDEIDSGRSSLSASDYSLLLHAREQLTIFWMKMALSHPQVSGCTSPKESDDYEDCAVTTRKVRSIYIILMHESNIFENYRYDPICGLDAIFYAPWVSGEKWPPEYGKGLPTTKSRLRPARGAKWRSIWYQEQKELWAGLNTWFELINEVEQDGAEELHD